ncbi:hypothetical protein [Deinococcus radiophilus]|uniref:Uncharacterized protein n=1 Tax=Deinococcus radiophilus TaxID=32062 RepID=A0A431W0V9_9DEIO|nr:hypothetical protein [Deinococcus radiophilus]RTR29046.1 hypothetical protein EJ104_04165 [Deinococcus radiophilus]UFA49632.1 hypothetical protein LMT64_06920 [Deinococcus radiophilus]
MSAVLEPGTRVRHTVPGMRSGEVEVLVRDGVIERLVNVCEWDRQQDTYRVRYDPEHQLLPLGGRCEENYAVRHRLEVLGPPVPDFGPLFEGVQP